MLHRRPHVLLVAALAAAFVGGLVGSAGAQQSRYVVDGADRAIFFGESTALLFRIQNNTGSDAPFSWTISGPAFSASGTVLVPRLKDELVESATDELFSFGGHTFSITLTQLETFEVITASLDIRVVDSFNRHGVQTVEDFIYVDSPLQKPITIRIPASPVPSPPSDPNLEKGRLPAYPFFVTRFNPDPGTPGDLFDVSPASGVIVGPLSSTLNTFVTVSVPIGGVPYGTMNTITYNIVVPGDTVTATGQAIFQGACHTTNPPSCPPLPVPSLWSVSFYDAYLAPVELKSLWCGVHSSPGYAAAPGYGSCWDASVYLRLGTQAEFSAAGGMTLGGVQLYSSEKAHDLCRIELGIGFLPDTITTWKEVAVFSGISNPDSTVCPDWPTKPYLCARYTPFQVVIPAADVPNNTADRLFVRWLFTSDLIWDDEGAIGGVDTKGAWRIDHVSARGDVAPNSYYPLDPARTLTQDFELPLGPEWKFPLSLVYDCTGIDGADDAGGLPSGPAGAARPIIVSTIPNPTAAAAAVRFVLPRAAPATLWIEDVEGRLVRRIRLGFLRAGPNEFLWDGLRENGRPVASGIYFLRIESERSSESRRVAVIRR